MDNINIQLISYKYLKQNLAEFLDIISDGTNEYWGEKEFLYDLPHKWDLSIVLIINNKITGFIIASLKSDYSHIHKFFIHRNFRGLGYGEILLSNFEERILQNFKINKISLKVYKENFKAIQFYKMHNFIEEDFQDNLLILQKQI